MMREKETKTLRVVATGEGTSIRDLYNKVFHLHEQKVQSETAFELTACSLKAAAVEKVRESIGRDTPFAVALIHFATDNVGGAIETAEQIRNIDPWINFLMLSESSDHLNEIKGRVPPINKLFFVTQPFHPEHILQLTLILSALWRSEKDFHRVNKEMQDVSGELLETNKALTVLARNLENSRRESENRMVQRIRTLIMPVIQKLRNEKGLKQFKPDLDLLSAYIESLTADLASDLKVTSMLSRTEHQVASLIKNGMTSDEIAAHLNISLFTVKTHRKNIRKKLDIQNSGVNLRSFLESGLKED